MGAMGPETDRRKLLRFLFEVDHDQILYLRLATKISSSNLSYHMTAKFTHQFSKAQNLFDGHSGL